MRLRPSIRCALLATACCAVATDAAAQERAKPRRPGHPVVLWAYDEDYAAPGFLEAVRALGATAVQAAPDRDVKPLLDAGMWWYEDEASGKGTLALREAEWKPAWEKFWDARKEAWPSEDVRKRPRCLRDPKWVADMTEKTRAAARRAKDGNALWISLADEPSMTVRANPGDWCLCDVCVTAFREETKTAFRSDLPALNASWGTSYSSWDEVRPWTTAAIRARELPKEPESWNLAPWMATRSFQDRTFAACIARLEDVAREEQPDLDVGLAGLQAPSAFGGFDYDKLRPGFAEPYDIGLAQPILRNDSACVMAQTLFPSDDPRVSRLRLWRGIARGARATIVWSSRDALRRTESGFARTPFGDALRADLQMLSAPGGIGEKLTASRPPDDQVWLVVSQASVNVRWMLDSIEDGDTWPRRFGSYEAAHSTAIRSREAAWRALAQRSPRIVTQEPIPWPRTTHAADPRVVLVLSDAVALSDSDLNVFTRHNAKVVHEAPVAQFDADGHARSTAWKPAPRSDLVLDPGFARLPAIMEEFIGPPPLRANAARANGDAPTVEVRVTIGGDHTVYAVCVPMWDLAVGADGSATGTIPREELTITWSFGDGKPRAVRDELLGKDVGVAVSWKTVSDAAEPHVWSWKP